MKRKIITICIMLLAMQAFAFGEEGYFSEDPIWNSSYQYNSTSVAFVDIDRDGDLDIVFGNSDEQNTLYINNDGMLMPLPYWYSDPAKDTRCLAVGDIDGNGYMDIAFGNSGEANTIYLNSTGSLDSEPIEICHASEYTRSIVLADMDNDGDLDLVCGNTTQSNNMYINENGTLRATPDWITALTNKTMSIAIGDVDRNGYLDVVCGNSYESNTLYLNESGVLSPVPDWSSDAAAPTVSVMLGDVDGDGNLDLICGNESGPDALYLNQGGTFSQVADWSSVESNRTASMVLSDIDGDADLDLVCGNRGQTNTVYLNENGMLTLDPGLIIDRREETESIALGDIDGDGDLDLVCANKGENNSMMPNIHSLIDETTCWISGYTESTRSLDLGDIDEDGDLDLVCGNGGGVSPQPVRIYNNEGGTFSDIPIWNSNSLNTGDVELVDIDGDNDIDLMVAPYREFAQMYVNESGSLLSESTWGTFFQQRTRDIECGDVDGDGDFDLVFGNHTENNSLLLNSGEILSVHADWYSEPENITLSVALGDVDGDGDLDLACGNGGESNTLYLFEDGTFSEAPVWESGLEFNTTCIELGDMDGDGDLDLVCGNNGQFNAIYRNNNGMLSLLPDWSTNKIDETNFVLLEDVDSDGDLDMIFGLYNSSNEIYLNQGGSYILSEEWAPAQTATMSIAAGDVDNDGDLDYVCGESYDYNSLHLGISDPAFKGDDLASPTNHLPNNSAFIRDVAIDTLSINHLDVDFLVFDVESDPVYINLEYQYEGAPVWFRVSADGGNGFLGPLATSPAGNNYSVDWDISQMPFDKREVVMRLSVTEIPKRVSFTQHCSNYIKKCGPVVPLRPEIALPEDVLQFDTVSFGDTTSLSMTISNEGTDMLTIEDFILPTREMKIYISTPFDLSPGSSIDLQVFLMPRRQIFTTASITVISNDAVAPLSYVQVEADIKTLDVETDLLPNIDEIPLGQAVTIVVAPGPDVRIEQGILYYRNVGISETFDESIPLEPFGNYFSAVMPGELITEGGIEYYVRVENSGVFATDPSDAPLSVFCQAVEAPELITTSPTPNRGSEFIESFDIKVQVVLPTGASFEQGVLHYCRGGDTEYSDVPIQTGDPLPFAVIPDSIPGPYGVEYWAEVQTLTQSLTDPPFLPGLSPHCIRVTVLNMTESEVNPGEEYRLLSMPLDIEAPIAGIITDDLGGPDNTAWRMYAYLPDEEEYSEIPNDSLYLFEQGKGYWLITLDDHQLDTGPAEGLSTPTDSAFALVLAPGYNLIGDPFAFDVAWDSVLVDTLSGEPLTIAEAEGVVIEPLVSWVVGQGYSYNIRTLEPFDGYWVKNLMEKNVVLHVSPKAADDVQPVDEPLLLAGETGDGWSMGIKATCNDVCDSYNIIGMMDEAEIVWDRHDLSEPPMSPGPSLSLYFPHSDWSRHPGAYTKDIRGGYEELEPGNLFSAEVDDELWGHIWSFDVAKSFSESSGGDEVTLEFSAFEQVPAGAAVYLVDRDLERLINLRESSTYSFFLGRRDVVETEAEARFVLLVGSEEFMGEHEEELPLPPATTVLHQNYPNPFNPATVIRYEIASAGDVTICVYDVKGSLVRILEKRYREPGRYEVGWNGENERGSKVTSGIYFYRLQTSHTTKTRKMILLR